jgi:hypothetical protein
VIKRRSREIDLSHPPKTKTPEAIAERSLTSLREKLFKIGPGVVSHARYVTFQMADGDRPLLIEHVCLMGNPGQVKVSGDVSNSSRFNSA